jgi:hypothetical protein
LEEENASREITNCTISPAASQWIIRSGMQLYMELKRPYTDLTLKSKPLYGGEAGLCQQHWEFWKLRFSEVKDEVNEKVAEMAQQAVGEMKRIEKLARKRCLDLFTVEKGRASKSRRTATKKKKTGEMRCLIFYL